MTDRLLAALSPRLPRVALVTGAARRLGRAIALTLAEAGFAVGIHYRASAAEAEATVADIRTRGGRAAAFAADLAREAEVARLVPAVTDALGPIGVLVNSASLFERDEWHDATRATWDAHVEANLRAPFALMQAFAARLPEQHEGVVINVLDQRVWSLTPHFVSYTVSKAGLWTLTQTMALALAPRIRVAAIGPGPALPSPRQTAEQFARQSRSVPLGRGTGEAEIGLAVLAILAMPSFTGQMLALDGGQHLQWGPVPPSGADIE
jgi:NAD(P)-dependent dehydrogenase (short-subunit alcohol dehydrogenase family)